MPSQKPPAKPKTLPTSERDLLKELTRVRERQEALRSQIAELAQLEQKIKQALRRLWEEKSSSAKAPEDRKAPAGGGGDGGGVNPP